MPPFGSVRLGMWDCLAEEHQPQLLQWGHSLCQWRLMGWAMSQRGWGPLSLLPAARVAGSGRSPPPTDTPDPTSLLPLAPIKTAQHQALSESHQGWAMGHVGVRRGHEDRAELFLLEVSRAGTITNLQAPLLKCHPLPPSPAGQAASRVRATRQRQGLHFASAKSQTKPPTPITVPSLATTSSAWPCQRQGIHLPL